MPPHYLCQRKVRATLSVKLGWPGLGAVEKALISARKYFVRNKRDFVETKELSVMFSTSAYYVGDNIVKLAKDIKLCWFNITHGEYSCAQLYGKPALW